MKNISKTTIVAGVGIGGLGESLCIQLAEAGHRWRYVGWQST